MATNNSVDSPLSGTTGTGKFVGNVSPSISTSILDANGNPLITIPSTASAVNSITLTNSIANNPVILSASGSDTNIILNLQGKGTGGGSLQGTSTNDDAASGFVGQFFSTVVLSGSAVGLTTATPTQVLTLVLPAGDFDVWGNFTIVGSTTNITSVAGAINTSVAFPDTALYSFVNLSSNLFSAYGGALPQVRQKFASGGNTLILVAQATFAAGSATASGALYARRRR